MSHANEGRKKERKKNWKHSRGERKNYKMVNVSFYNGINKCFMGVAKTEKMKTEERNRRNNQKRKNDLQRL